MAKLIIIAGPGRTTRHDLTEPSVLGRTDEADIILPNVSVSRIHARMTPQENDAVLIEDLGSNNGVRVGGEKVDRMVIQPGDEVQIGRFTIVIAADDERFYKGRFIGYMTEHGARTTAVSGSTFALAAAEIEAIEARRKLITGARVRLATNSARYWYPEDKTLTFGKAAMIAIEGFLASGTVAEVAWDGQGHVVRKLGGITKVYVNEQSVGEARLSPGDSLRIGSTSFVYEVVDPDIGEDDDKQTLVGGTAAVGASLDKAKD